MRLSQPFLQDAKIGQRTTLNVLNAEQALLNARVQLISAQHHQMVNSHPVLSTIGGLSIKTLRLNVA